MKNGCRQLPGRNRSLQGVSGVLDVPAVQSLVCVIAWLFSFNFVFFHKLSVPKKFGLQNL